MDKIKKAQFYKIGLVKSNVIGGGYKKTLQNRSFTASSQINK
jgi:hypothetical protein